MRVGSKGARLFSWLSAGVLVIVVVVGVWWVTAPLPPAGLSVLAEVDTVLPVSGEQKWRSEGWGCTAEFCPREAHCDDFRCELEWHLLPDDSPRETGEPVVAASWVYGEQFGGSGSAAWAYNWTRPANWIPWNTVGADFPGVGTSADAMEINCYYNPYAGEPSKDGDGCVWEYWARYGQYVVGLSYGSDVNPITLDEFQRLYVQPIDRRLAEAWGLDL